MEDSSRTGVGKKKRIWLAGISLLADRMTEKLLKAHVVRVASTDVGRAVGPGAGGVGVVLGVHHLHKKVYFGGWSEAIIMTSGRAYESTIGRRERAESAHDFLL